LSRLVHNTHTATGDFFEQHIVSEIAHVAARC
jgi:hypothetical protein